MYEETSPSMESPLRTEIRRLYKKLPLLLKGQQVVLFKVPCGSTVGISYLQDPLSVLIFLHLRFPTFKIMVARYKINMLHICYPRRRCNLQNKLYCLLGTFLYRFITLKAGIPIITCYKQLVCLRTLIIYIIYNLLSHLTRIPPILLRAKMQMCDMKKLYFLTPF